jgi:hypothetical protein
MREPKFFVQLMGWIWATVCSKSCLRPITIPTTKYGNFRQALSSEARSAKIKILKAGTYVQ